MTLRFESTREDLDNFRRFGYSIEFTQLYFFNCKTQDLYGSFAKKMSFLLVIEVVKPISIILFSYD